MLRLDKLEMSGFKSFFSRTEFLFHNRITAVVGPNGCGKSNIGDALNWVIGEQSVKSLRGDRMEDVIFNGSESRRPLGMAEVVLHLRGEAAEGGDDRLVISRRLFRSGESDYLMNGERCRLRDLQETLAKVNVGSGLYAIIEQGKVDAALNGKPRERRALIEEAAGVSIYKARRRQAESKLEATEANLFRVNDIVVEIEKQIGSLRRQAARARRYARTMEEIGRHERVVMFHDHKRLEQERIDVEARENAAKAMESHAAAHLSGIEAALEDGRRRMEERESGWRDRRESLHGLDREIDRLERDRDLALRVAQEAGAGIEESVILSMTLVARLADVSRQIEISRARRTDLEMQVGLRDAERAKRDDARRSQEERIEQLESDLAGRRSVFLETADALAEARNRRGQVEEIRERLARQQAALDREKVAARATLAGAIQGKDLAASGLAAAVERLDRLRAEQVARRTAQERLEESLTREGTRRQDAVVRLHGQQERLSALKEIEAAAASARDVLAGAVEHDGICADLISAPERIEAAAETFLHDLLDAALVRGRKTAVAAVTTLKRLGRGRASFIAAPLPGLAGRGGGEEGDPLPAIAVPEAISESPDYVGRLSDLIEVAADWREALRPALARGIVVTDLDAAVRLSGRAPFFDFVTLDGDIVRSNGLVQGGVRRPEGAGILTRRRLIADLETGVESSASQLARLETLVVGLESEKGTGSEDLAEISGATAAAESDVAARRVSHQAALSEEERARTVTLTVELEKDSVGQEEASLALEFERLVASVAALEQARQAREAEIADGQAEIGELRSTVAQAVEAIAAARAELSAAASRLESSDAELARLREQGQELGERKESEKARSETLLARKDEAETRARETAESQTGVRERRALLQREVSEGEVVLSEARLALETLGHDARTAREDLEGKRSERELITIAKERAISDLRHLFSGVAGDAVVDPVDYFAGISDEDKALEANLLKSSLEALRARRDSIGPVNMMALDQFRELEERYGFMTAQRKDLTDAIASLRDTISRINRTSRERFMEAFEKIREGFVDCFTTLFDGGQGDLRLVTEEGEEVLECGVEIVAQPPGKRLQSISLMSGGEKALTAMALLFAIFRYRPSPFCVLDEVDAPLDEANVMRFNRLLASMSEQTQFVLITHNRRTMEAADMLYGITMEEPGVSRTISVVVDGQTERSEAIRSLPAMLAARHKGAGRRIGGGLRTESPVAAAAVDGNGHSEPAQAVVSPG